MLDQSEFNEELPEVWTGLVQNTLKNSQYLISETIFSKAKSIKIKCVVTKVDLLSNLLNSKIKIAQILIDNINFECEFNRSTYLFTKSKIIKNTAENPDIKDNLYFYLPLISLSDEDSERFDSGCSIQIPKKIIKQVFIYQNSNIVGVGFVDKDFCLNPTACLPDL